MKPKFWWLNANNGVEYSGPFVSEEAAQRNAVGTYKLLDDATIIILQEVSRGEVRFIASPVEWKK